MWAEVRVPDMVRFLVWTILCVGLGIFLGTVDLGGQTAWERARGAWKQQGPRMEKVKDGAEDLVDKAKKKVSSSPDPQPKERHSEEERQAIDAIIAKKGKG